jgi:hypothetical protein
MLGGLARYGKGGSIWNDAMETAGIRGCDGMTLETIRFTWQTDELIAARNLPMNSEKDKRLLLTGGTFISLVWLVVGILMFARHRDTLLRVVSVVDIICGLFLAAVVLYGRLSFANDVKGGITYEFTIDEQGIEAVVPKPFTVAWKNLASVRDFGTSLVFMQRLGWPIVIPKRAFRDGGSALWHFLEGEFVESRYLVRGSGAPLTITNTRAR